MSHKNKLFAAAKQSNRFSVHSTTNGYSVRMPRNAGFWARLAQALSGGLAFMSFGFVVGMWVLPGSNFGSDVALFKLVISGLLVLVGLLALWFATLGTTYELQIDSVKRELREVLCNQKGQSLVLRRMDFDHIRSVVLLRDTLRNLPGQVSLVLRHKTQGHSITLVTDKSERLVTLREVLAGDILLGEVGAAKPQGITPRRVVLETASVAAQ